MRPIVVIGAVFPDKPEEQGLKIMSRICELTGKTRQVGHNVSHANNKTKRVFLPNLQDVTLISESLEKSVKLRVSTHGLRSVERSEEHTSELQSLMRTAYAVCCWNKT